MTLPHRVIITTTLCKNYHCMTHRPPVASATEGLSGIPSSYYYRTIVSGTPLWWSPPSYCSHLPRHLLTEHRLRSRSSIIAEATSRFRTSADKSNDIRRRLRPARAHLNDVGDSVHDVVERRDSGVWRHCDDVPPAWWSFCWPCSLCKVCSHSPFPRHWSFVFRTSQPYSNDNHSPRLDFTTTCLYT